VSAPVKRGLADLEVEQPEGPKVRQADPPTKAQQARERALESRQSPAEYFADKLRRMADMMAPAAPAEPLHTPPPPQAAKSPAKRPALTLAAINDGSTAAEKLQALKNVAAGSAPCVLTREELGPGPSEQMLRFARAAREQLEEAERQTQRREAEHKLRKLLGYPVFGV
jgi:hypothetical protein